MYSNESGTVYVKLNITTDCSTVLTWAHKCSDQAQRSGQKGATNDSFVIPNVSVIDQSASMLRKGDAVYSTGNWTAIRDKVRQLKDFLESQEDQIPQWTWLNWLNSGSWTHILQKIASIIAVIFLLCVIVFCCIVPCLSDMISRATSKLPGMYIQTPMVTIVNPEAPEYIEQNNVLALLVEMWKDQVTKM